MPLVTAICPTCKKQIEIDSAETIDFCKLCGKPYNTQEAIKLYTEQVVSNQNGRKPAQEVIDKFNAILAQDCVLALQYLGDVVQKEYPKLYDTFHLKGEYFSRGSSLHSISSLGSEISGRELSSIYNVKMGSFNVVVNCLHEIYPLNTYIADMYFKVLCARVNYVLKEKLNKSFSGALPELKIRLGSMEDRLNDIVYDIYCANKNNYSFLSYSQDELLLGWKELIEIVKEHADLRGKEFDDEYIMYLIDFLDRYSHSTKRNHIFHDAQMVLYGEDFVCGPYIANFISKHNIKCDICSLDDLSKYFEGFLSLQGKKQRETQRRVEKKATYTNAYNSKLSFWLHYIELLTAGNIKEAQTFLEKDKERTEVYWTEIVKFKKSVFGVKYTGDVASLDAKKLTELSVQHLKK